MIKVSSFKKCPLVVENENDNGTEYVIFSFSISALPEEGTFQMLIHFRHLWPLGHKRYIQFFERCSDSISSIITG